MRFGLSEKDISEILGEINENLGTSNNPKVYIYGSRVKGSHREYSDIDLLLKANSYDEEAISNIDFKQLDTPYKVDFVLDKDLFNAYRQDIEDHMVEFK